MWQPDLLQIAKVLMARQDCRRTKTLPKPDAKQTSRDSNRQNIDSVASQRHAHSCLLAAALHPLCYRKKHARTYLTCHWRRSDGIRKVSTPSSALTSSILRCHIFRCSHRPSSLTYAVVSIMSSIRHTCFACRAMAPAYQCVQCPGLQLRPDGNGFDLNTGIHRQRLDGKTSPGGLVARKVLGCAQSPVSSAACRMSTKRP